MNDTPLPAAMGTEALAVQDRANCAALAALLHATVQATCCGWRLLLVMVAWLALGMALLCAPQPWPTSVLGGCALGLLLVAALLGLVLRIQLFRMRLDERLFGALAQGHIASLKALDVALQCTTGRRFAANGPPDLSQRIRGTKALVKRAVLTMFAQTVAIIAALPLSLLMLRDLLH